jgi:hypothetical protein
MTQSPGASFTRGQTHWKSAHPSEKTAYQGGIPSPVIEPQHHQTFLAWRRCRRSAKQRSAWEMCCPPFVKHGPYLVRASIEHSNAESRGSINRLGLPSTDGRQTMRSSSGDRPKDLKERSARFGGIPTCWSTNLSQRDRDVLRNPVLAVAARLRPFARFDHVKPAPRRIDAVGKEFRKAP